MWVYGTDSIPAAGELYAEGASVHLHRLDSAGGDQAADLEALEAGDRVIFTAAGGALVVLIAEVEDPLTDPADVVTMHGTVTATGDWPPAAGAPVTVTYQPAPSPTQGRSNMPTEVFKIARGEVGFSLTDPGKAVADAVIADYTDFSCTVTRGLVTASSNFDTDEIPGTFCDPAAETVTPSAPTFELVLDVLQDPQIPTGLAQFLWDNDSGVTGSPVWFYLGLAEGAAPKIIGQCYVSPMDFGGEARTVLTASLTFPCEGRPSPEWGITADI